MHESRSIRITNDTFIRGILIILGSFLLYKLSDILLLILVSIVIASFVEAGVHMFAKYNVRRVMSVPIIFAVVTIFLATIFYAFIPVVVRELSGMVTLIVKYLPHSSAVNSESIQDATQFVDTLSKHASLNDVFASLRSASGTLTQGATSVLGSTFGSLLNIILVIVMSFYLSIQEKGIESFLRILTPVRHERYVIDLWTRTQRKIGLWFKGQLLLGFIMGVITFIVLALLNVQYAFLLGLVSGIFELIPFGIIFAAIPAILFAVIDGGLLLGVKVLVFYVVIQQIENYVLSPVVARRIVGIPPLVVLLAFLVGITLAGFWGAIIAMPVAVFVLEYMGDIEKRKLVPVETNTPE